MSRWPAAPRAPRPFYPGDLLPGDKTEHGYVVAVVRELGEVTFCVKGEHASSRPDPKVRVRVINTYKRDPFRSRCAGCGAST